MQRSFRGVTEKESKGETDGEKSARPAAKGQNLSGFPLKRSYTFIYKVFN